MKCVDLAKKAAFLRYYGVKDWNSRGIRYSLQATAVTVHILQLKT